MHKVNISETINSSANNVWKLVGDFGGLDTFVEAITKCTTEIQNADTVRTLTLQDGAEVKEKLEHLDNKKMILEYSILESPMPIKNYKGKMEVNALSDSKSEFTWSSSFEAAEGAGEEMEKTLAGLYSLGVEGLKHKLN